MRQAYGRQESRAVGDLQIVIAALFVSAAGLNALANWLQVPYPIPLVLGGLVLGLVPGIPDIELDPDLVLLVFLPPLLYAAAFFADLRALRTDARVDLAARRSASCWRRRRRSPCIGARADRAAVGDGLRARRDRLADRPGGRHGDHAPRRRAAADRQRPRGREPLQRRDRAGRLQGRGRGGGRRERLGRGTPCSSSSATPAGASRSGWRSAGSIARGPKPRRRRQHRADDLAASAPTGRSSRPTSSASPACWPWSPAASTSACARPEIASPETPDAGLRGCGRSSSSCSTRRSSS